MVSRLVPARDDDLTPRFARLALLAAAMIATTSERSARACSCAPQGVMVRPGGNEVAPVNTHVWLFVPPPTPPPEEGPPVAARQVHAQLRGPDGRDVPTRRLTSRSGSMLVVELMPEHDLRPRAGYEVEVVVPAVASRFDQKSLVSPSTTRYRITTGEERASVPREWSGVPIARYQHPSGGGCDAHEPMIMMEDGKERPGLHEHPPLYAIWTGRREGDIDYGKRPDLAVYGLLELGRWSICRHRNFIIRPGPLRLGIKLVDLAGNYGKRISEVQFDDIPASCTGPLPLEGGYSRQDSGSCREGLRSGPRPWPATLEASLRSSVR